MPDQATDVVFCWTEWTEWFEQEHGETIPITEGPWPVKVVSTFPDAGIVVLEIEGNAMEFDLSGSTFQYSDERESAFPDESASRRPCTLEASFHYGEVVWYSMRFEMISDRWVGLSMPNDNLALSEA